MKVDYLQLSKIVQKATNRYRFKPKGNDMTTDEEMRRTDRITLIWLVVFTLVMSIIFVLMAALPRARAQTPVPPPVTAEFSAAFCAGWNSAVQLEAQRAASWRALVTAARTEDSAKTDAGIKFDMLVNSIAAYVLISPLRDKVTLGDGRVVDCAPPKQDTPK